MTEQSSARKKSITQSAQIKTQNSAQNRKKPINRKLSQKEKTYISYCEKFYFLNNFGFPTNEQAAVALGYSISEIQTFLLNRKVQSALESRGLPYLQSKSQSELTPTQVAAAITISNFADERSIDQKLDQLGVLPATYYTWLNDPTYQSFVQNLADRNLEIVRPEAVAQFTKLLRTGDFAALKYYFEVTGQFQQPEITNIKILVQKLVESVQKHVKDPEILLAITQDLMGTAPVAGSQPVALQLNNEKVTDGNNSDT